MRITVDSETFWGPLQKCEFFTLPPKDENPDNGIHGYVTIAGVSIPVYIKNND